MKHSGLRFAPSILWKQEAQDLCLEIAQEFVDEIEADPNVPVDQDGPHPGNMKFGFEADEWRDGARVTNRRAPYWIYVNYGHDVVDEAGEVVGHVAPRPFATKAWEIVRGRGSR